MLARPQAVGGDCAAGVAADGDGVVQHADKALVVARGGAMDARGVPEEPDSGRVGGVVEEAHEVGEGVVLVGWGGGGGHGVGGGLGEHWGLKCCAGGQVRGEGPVSYGERWRGRVEALKKDGRE